MNLDIKLRLGVPEKVPDVSGKTITLKKVGFPIDCVANDFFLKHEIGFSSSPLPLQVFPYADERHEGYFMNATAITKTTQDKSKAVQVLSVPTNSELTLTLMLKDKANRSADKNYSDDITCILEYSMTN